MGAIHIKALDDSLKRDELTLELIRSTPFGTYDDMPRRTGWKAVEGYELAVLTAALSAMVNLKGYGVTARFWLQTSGSDLRIIHNGNFAAEVWSSDDAGTRVIDLTGYTGADRSRHNFVSPFEWADRERWHELDCELDSEEANNFIVEWTSEKRWERHLRELIRKDISRRFDDGMSILRISHQLLDQFVLSGLEDA